MATQAPALIAIPKLRLKKVGYATGTSSLPNKRDLNARANLLVDYSSQLERQTLGTRLRDELSEVDKNYQKIWRAVNPDCDVSFHTSIFEKRFAAAIGDIVSICALDFPWLINSSELTNALSNIGSSSTVRRIVPDLLRIGVVSKSTSMGANVSEIPPSGAIPNWSHEVWVTTPVPRFRPKNKNKLLNQSLRKLNLYFIRNDIPLFLRVRTTLTHLSLILIPGMQLVRDPSSTLKSISRKGQTPTWVPASYYSDEELMELMHDSIIHFGVDITAVGRLPDSKNPMEKRFLIDTEVKPFTPPDPTLSGQPDEFQDWLQIAARKKPLPENTIDPIREIPDWYKLNDALPIITRLIKLLMKRMDPIDVLSVTPIS